MASFTSASFGGKKRKPNKQTKKQKMRNNPNCDHVLTDWLPSNMQSYAVTSRLASTLRTSPDLGPTRSPLPTSSCSPSFFQASLRSARYCSRGLFPFYLWVRHWNKAKERRSLSPVPFPRQLWSPSYRLVPYNWEVGAAGKILGDGNGGIKIEDNMPPASWYKDSLSWFL